MDSSIHLYCFIGFKEFSNKIALDGLDKPKSHGRLLFCYGCS